VSKVILDTNIALDVFVFNDPASAPLKQALIDKKYQWIATQPMRDELERVLAYKHIVPRLVFYKITALDVLAQFDKFVQLQPVAPKASAICKDPDDQKFIDLAVAHRAILLSKDNAVISMRKRLAALDCQAQTAM
jgi:putative PIN family toxin of toxin-antitoxin system